MNKKEFSLIVGFVRLYPEYMSLLSLRTTFVLLTKEFVLS